MSGVLDLSFEGEGEGGIDVRRAVGEVWPFMGGGGGGRGC